MMLLNKLVIASSVLKLVEMTVGVGGDVGGLGREGKLFLRY